MYNNKEDKIDIKAQKTIKSETYHIIYYNQNKKLKYLKL